MIFTLICYICPQRYKKILKKQKFSQSKFNYFLLFLQIQGKSVRFSDGKKITWYDLSEKCTISI